MRSHNTASYQLRSCVQLVQGFQYKTTLNSPKQYNMTTKVGIVKAIVTLLSVKKIPCIWKGLEFGKIFIINTDKTLYFDTVHSKCAKNDWSLDPQRSKKRNAESSSNSSYYLICLNTMFCHQWMVVLASPLKTRLNYPAFETASSGMECCCYRKYTKFF